jgi:DNA-binding response OmpR family regulator
MLPAPLILVAEDDPHTRDYLTKLLEMEDYRVEGVADGLAALARCQASDVDLVVLDRGLPKLNGLAVCEQLTAQTGRRPPIIMLTAFAQTEQRLEGFAAGVDDYVVKPFSPGELVARIESVLRRTAPRNTQGPRRIDERLQIDFAEHEVIIDGEHIALKRTETDMLRVLVEHAGEVVPFATILTEVWGPAYTDATQYVHLYVNYLRRKIEPNPRKPRYICTKRGIGYRFVLPAATPEPAAAATGRPNR